MYHIRERFDPDLLDPDDPFEVDDFNLPHLYKHSFSTPEGLPIRIELSDILDLWAGNAVVLYPADVEKGPADWLMVGEVDGMIVTVPLAPPRSHNPAKCRPIGLYPASAAEREAYRHDI